MAIQFATFLLISTSVSSQGFSLTAALGTCSYVGDLTNGSSPVYKPAYSLGAAYDFTNRFRLRLNLSGMSVQADDLDSKLAYMRQRNLSFKSAIQEASLLGEFDILDNSFNSIIPYVFVGPSVYHFDPHPLRTIKGIGDVSLHSIGTEGQNIPGLKNGDTKYNLTQLNIQMGFGVRYEISEKVSLGVEVNYRNLFTDYLDDVSGKYIDRNTWDSAISKASNSTLIKQLEAGKAYGWNRLDPKTGVPIIQDPTLGNNSWPRGNPSKNDVYYTFQVRLSIKLSSIESGTGFYSPRNPSGRRQLRCARAVY